ncbi:carbamoyltransferase HypF [Kitasatospora sp. NPDC101155]|uniref:carbamoyltransferase HypF n=1 Tax=Kitasatospora sp. NPDC101155 TaxID=3364097 RepID=UPI0037FFA2D2
MTTELRMIEVYGTVQGVGFRPFVHRLATSLGLTGWVRNEDGHVVSLVSGPSSVLSEYAVRLDREAPPLAVVTAVRSHPAPPGEEPGADFTVLASTCAASGLPRDIPPDAATCPDCLRELFDPADRRYRYPFTNCTACGPRATIIDDLPYDRQRTAMRTFPLCRPCAAEYADPTDRRFHAEPVACPACGPTLAYGARRGEQALAAAEAALCGGAIIALKGLGGYQLVCDAADEQAVQRLRAGKQRPAKPFAVMAPDLAAVDRLARPTPAEEDLLTTTARPIVLLAARTGNGLAPAVHPGTDRVGLFLPYTPLHHLLLHDLGSPLVVTSGNRSDEPIAIDDAEALRTLGPIADGFLTHNRPIRARYDDSVTHAPLGTPAVLRRARGYAPAPLPLPHTTPEPVLAVGAQLKSTFTLAIGDRAVPGPHVGDLQDADTLGASVSALHRLTRLQAVEPAWVAHDLHPDYRSTAYAAAHWPPERRIAVQHHHAHVASCAAEHGLTGPFVGVAYDGLGLGDDGTLWGGEILLADLTGYRRVGRFARAPLPGGEAAIRRPVRMALGYLCGLERLSEPPEDTFSHRLDPREVRTVRRMIERGFNSPPASSAGRLFDAVSALLGLCDDATYEGEAAVALEQAAGALAAAALPWRLDRVDGLAVYDPAPTLTAVLRRTDAGEPPGPIAAAFHRTFAEVTGALVAEVVRNSGADTVCLSGGCFQNCRLLTEVHAELTGQGLRVLTNSAVPANDGGISYGQAAVAAARLAVAEEG